MNVLMISTWPPMPCGIGQYALQQTEALRREGHHVDVLTPPEGEGDFQDVLLGGMRPLRLLRYLWAYKRACLHFATQFFYLSEPHNRGNRLLTSLSFLLLTLSARLARREFHFILHEAPFKLGQVGRGPLRHRIDRWYWRLAGRVIFHSAREREEFARFYRLSPDRPNFEVSPHERYMTPRCPLDRGAARRQLGVAPGETLFLCLGFIQPHKGFDRAIRAFQQVAGDHLRLKIIGSVRINWEPAHRCAMMLHELAQRDPRTEVIEQYLSDEAFDLWVLAADYVVLPYTEIWTSSVAARARLLGRPMLAADTGGLAEQLTEGSALFRDEAELTELIRGIAARDQVSSTTTVANEATVATSSTPQRV